MTQGSDRCEEYRRFKNADSAFRAGDLEALRIALGNPAGFLNVRGPKGIECCCLQYAIYHSPLGFIRTLLELGADPNYDDGDGFPSLIAALSCSRSQPGAPGRPDVAEIIKLLLAFGADPNQRGINDYTPLHMAASERNVPAVELLLEAGADPHLRTRIDDCETPREMAEHAGFGEIAELLAAQEARREK